MCILVDLVRELSLKQQFSVLLVEQEQQEAKKRRPPRKFLFDEYRKQSKTQLISTEYF